MKLPKMIPLEHGDAEQLELLATVCLGMRNVRRNARRGLVATRRDANDDRGIADVPDYSRLSDSWRLLNFFSEQRTLSHGKNELAQLFYQLADDCWFDSSAQPYELAKRIGSAALTAVTYGRKHGWC